MNYLFINAFGVAAWSVVHLRTPQIVAGQVPQGKRRAIRGLLTKTLQISLGRPLSGFGPIVWKKPSYVA